jgi:formylglycine-generating enzyme required for sulfatase activity
MNELVRDELIRIVRENSEDVLLDPVRTKAFLNDFCGNKYRREINSITLALKEGAATELLNSRRNRTERFAIARLSKNLEESFGFPRQQTIWTVESIAIALGIIESDSIKTSVKDTEKESEGRHSSVETASSTQTNLVVDQRKETQIDESSYARSDNTAKTKPDREIRTPNGDELVYVGGGSFVMGDTWGDEKPTHKVTFTYDFYIGRYEVTFSEYDAFCEAIGRKKTRNRRLGRRQRPAINVNWWNTSAYCNWLSEKEKLPKAYDSNGNLLDKDGRITTDPSEVLGYRLPTEAEWEHAARGGNKSKGYKYSGSDNVNDVAWYWDNAGRKTQEVGKKAPNELGIYDMSGNVWEWCSDWYDSGYYAKSPTTNPYNGTAGSYRVLRGGSWCYYASVTRVANRGSSSPTNTSYDLGFRIARTVH